MEKIFQGHPSSYYYYYYGTVSLKMTSLFDVLFTTLWYRPMYINVLSPLLCPILNMYLYVALQLTHTHVYYNANNYIELYV